MIFGNNLKFAIRKNEHTAKTNPKRIGATHMLKMSRTPIPPIACEIVE